MAKKQDLDLSNLFKKCLDEAKKYYSNQEFKNGNKKLYLLALKNDWLAKCKENYIDANNSNSDKVKKGRKSPRLKYSFEYCLNNALHFSKVKYWILDNRHLYLYCTKKGWLNDCTAHMKKISEWEDKNNSIEFDLEKCIKSASKHKSLLEWIKSDEQVFLFACKNNLINECNKHMLTFFTPKHLYMNIDFCIENALPFKKISEWIIDNKKIYDYAYRKGWLKECTAHMNRKERKKRVDKRTKQKCIDSALKFSNIREWKKKDFNSYNKAHDNGWINECCAHMIYSRKINKKSEL